MTVTAMIGARKSCTRDGACWRADRITKRKWARLIRRQEREKAMAIQTVNPATGEIVQTFDELDDAGIEAVLARAADVFERHRRLSLAERAERMNKAADILEQDQDRWGAMMTEEMGKPLKAAVAEAVKCAWVCRYYAEHAKAFLADEPMESDASNSFVRYLPMGPVLAVMPWNFPFWQVLRFAAPALMAGNVGLLKHASNVPQSALAIEEIFDRAGFEKGTFQTLLVGSGKVEKILKDSRVKAATLTGSEGAGAAVAATAGEEIKHTVLELGGSDPFIIMPSADVDKALETAVIARNINNGQSCIAAKRFIVHQDIYDDFEARFVAKFESVTVGDPMSDDTDIGPLAMAQIRDEIDEQVAQSVAKGARKLTGAEVMRRWRQQEAEAVCSTLSPARRVILVAVTGNADLGVDDEFRDGKDADIIWGKPFPSPAAMLDGLNALPEFRGRLTQGSG